jgi:hypothetical protein
VNDLYPTIESELQKMYAFVKDHENS